MRLFSLLAALVLSLVIYGIVFEREQLTELVSPSERDQAAESAANENASDSPDNEDGDTADGVVGVIAVRSDARDVETVVNLRGQTEAFRQVDLSAETDGAVVSEPLRKGAFVNEDDVLCRIAPGTREAVLAEMLARLAEAEAQVPAAEAQIPESEARIEEARAQSLEARARLREAEINFNAAERLIEGGFASQTRLAQTEAEVQGAKAQIVSADAALKAAETGLETVSASIEAARAGVESAQAAVAAARKELERLEMKAPFSGLLESDTAELGSFLMTGARCATIIQLDPIMLVGFVPETEISKVRTGSTATARLASGEMVEGEVTFVSRSADPTTRTFRVEIEVANPDFELRDGQSAEIKVSAQTVQAHLLPQSALTLSDEGVLGVRIVATDNTARFLPISILRDAMEGVYITGLPQVANVIVIGQEFVADNVPVAPSYKELGQ